MWKKAVFFIAGFALVITGIALALKDWYFLVMVFRGLLGPLVAVIGLVILALIKE